MATQGDMRVSLTPLEKGLILPSSVPILRGENHFCRERTHEDDDALPTRCGSRGEGMIFRGEIDRQGRKDQS